MGIGIEGIALAIGLFLFFTYAMPAFAARRIVVDATPIDERYADNLRLISAQADAPRRSTDHGRIFVMNDQQRSSIRASRTARQSSDTFDVRGLLRSRGEARRRMEQRRVRFARLLVAEIAVAALVLGLWIAVWLKAIGLLWPTISSAVVVVTGLAFGCAAYRWNVADTHDAERITRIEARLEEAGFKPRRARRASEHSLDGGRSPRTLSRKEPQAKRSQGARSRSVRDTYRQAADAERQKYSLRNDTRTGEEESRLHGDVELMSKSRDGVQVGDLRRVAELSGNTRDVHGIDVHTRKADVRDGVRLRSANDDRSTSSASTRRDGTSGLVSGSRVYAQNNVSSPSYTIKSGSAERRSVSGMVHLPKRSVKISDDVRAAQAEYITEDASPYRPKQLGERIGSGVIPQANAAPEMTGAEEMRNDVLGGGSMLDALLERRRA